MKSCSPRTEIVAFQAESSIDEAVKLALRHRHSRVPVYEQTIDNVVGVLSTKDLLGVVARRGASGSAAEPTTVRRLMRPPLVVPQGATVAEVLAAMKANRQPMAIVLDEYGGTEGVVTLSDLVTRLLGSVGDEYTAATHEIRTLGDGTVVADGLALVDDVNAELNAHFDRARSIRSAAWCSRSLADVRRSATRSRSATGGERASSDSMVCASPACACCRPTRPRSAPLLSGKPEEDGAA